MTDRISDVEHLEELLSEPTPGVIETMRRLKGDLLVLGVGGKMGPSLARMATRASSAAGVNRRVFGVSRFSSQQLPDQLRAWNIEPVTCDLLNCGSLTKIPDAENIVYMAGMKFGSTGQEARTWAMNAYLPGMICERFPKSKIIAFSTGNVYGLVPVASGGSTETDVPNPLGDYAMSCLGRERIFEHFSGELNIPMTLIRLNYAVEMRYGVLVDLARNVFAGESIDLAMGHFNCIWQGDANAQALQSFDHLASPPTLLNVTGNEVLSVRQVCEELGTQMSKSPRFVGTESPKALLANASKSKRLFGEPTVGVSQMLRWIADWVSRGGETLGKPTHFESRDGKF